MSWQERYKNAPRVPYKVEFERPESTEGVCPFCKGQTHLSTDVFEVPFRRDGQEVLAQTEMLVYQCEGENCGIPTIVPEMALQLYLGVLPLIREAGDKIKERQVLDSIRVFQLP